MEQRWEPRVLSLNGNCWQLLECYDDEWEHRRVYDKDFPIEYWRNAKVPSCVHLNLLEAGEIEDPYFELNSKNCEWIAGRTWVYARDFLVDPMYKGARIRLLFKGIDYKAHFYVNGIYLGSTGGMFSPSVFEIQGLIDYDGSNRVCVVIEKPPILCGQMGRSSTVYARKPRVNYHWDFAAKLVTMGIWRDVELIITGDVFVEDLWIRTYLMNEERALVKTECVFDSKKSENYKVCITIKMDGQTVCEKELAVWMIEGINQVSETLVIDNPRLWWPNGSGEASVYVAEVKVYEMGTNKVVDEYGETFGIRTISFVTNENAPESSLPYTAIVNGKRVFIRGWNWVPIDLMHGRQNSEKYKTLIELAKQANINLLRIWGGGLIETEEFYDLCDRNGIMIWQEFPLSGSALDSVPPQDSEFVTGFVKEAELIIKEKRNHPALVIWCGGNELTRRVEDVQFPLSTEEHALLRALKATIDRMDPGRYFLPTSPSGNCFSSDASTWPDGEVGHDVHGSWYYLGIEKHYDRYNTGKALFHSEFGAPGATRMASLRKFVSESNIWPASRDNPIWVHHGNWWVNNDRVNEVFGPVDNIRDFIYASQYLQAEGLRYPMEEYSRNRWYCSGIIPWQFNEPWPNTSCTSVVDWYCEPKMAYYVGRNVYSPIHVSLRYGSLIMSRVEDAPATIWLTNELDEGAHVNVRLRIVDIFDTPVYEKDWQMEVLPLCAQEVATLPSLEGKVKDLFIVQLEISACDGVLESENTYFFGTGEFPLRSMMTADKVELEVVDVETTTDNGRRIHDIAIRNNGCVYALMVNGPSNLGPNAYGFYQKNFIHIPPRETRNIRLITKEGDIFDGAVVFEGWNTNPVECKLF